MTVVDYGMGNLHSAVRKFRRVGSEPRVSDDPGRVAEAQRLVLPGVGHFGRAMANLRASGLAEALDHAVLGRGVPVLGICLGMQLLARSSEEGDAEGLGWIDAEVVRLRVSDTLRYKVPHTGWNTVEPRGDCALFRGLPDEPEFSFVHAYHVVCHDAGDEAGRTTYDIPFASAVQRGNIYGVQFHPEKSHAVGEALLRNFVTL